MGSRRHLSAQAASRTRRSAALDPRAWVAGQFSGLGERSDAVRASVPRRPHGRIRRRLPHRERAGRIAEPARLLRRTRSSVRLEPRRPVRAVRPVLLVGARRQRLEPPVRDQRDARQPPRGRVAAGGLSGHDHDLRPARGCGRPVALLRQGLRPDEHHRPPRPGRAGFPARSRCHCWRCRAWCVRRGSRRTSSICRSSTAMRRPDGFPRSRTSRLARVNEHPPAKLVAGQTFVRSIVNELMRSPEWSSTAFVLTYDSWGGWYDHVRTAEGRSLRLRFPSAGAPRQPVRQDAARSTTTRSTPRRSCVSSRTTGTSLRSRGETRTRTASRRRSTSRIRHAPPCSSRRARASPTGGDGAYGRRSSGRMEARSCSRLR